VGRQLDPRGGGLVVVADGRTRGRRETPRAVSRPDREREFQHVTTDYRAILRRRQRDRAPSACTSRRVTQPGRAGALLVRTSQARDSGPAARRRIGRSARGSRGRRDAYVPQGGRYSFGPCAGLMAALRESDGRSESTVAGSAARPGGCRDCPQAACFAGDRVASSSARDRAASLMRS